MAGPAPALYLPLHTDLVFVAQRRRGVLRQTCQAETKAWCDVLKVCSRNPVAFIGASNPAAREAITRHNDHALQFLTAWPPPA